MKRILWMCLLSSSFAYAQNYKLDTLTNAKAFINTFSLLPFHGTTNMGGEYVAGFNEIIDKNGSSSGIELIRIDIDTKNSQSKKIDGFKIGNWGYTFDDAGNIYLSMTSPDRKVLLLNLKDSIFFKDLGNLFQNNTALAYSLSLGVDGNVYFGSSGGGTYWSEYNTKNKKIIKHPIVDSLNDYVLSIAGDSKYAYLQTGQRKSINLWSVNKSTNEKKLLFKIPNTTRYNLSAFTDGIYVSFSTDTLKGNYKLVNGNAEMHYETAKERKLISGLSEPGVKKSKELVYYFDPGSSQLKFSYDKKNYEGVPIKNAGRQTGVRRLFAFPNDKENIYYAGDYYGNYYRYNLKEHKAYLLGATGYNIYSSYALNDSMIYFSGYPSGYIMLWNKNQPWTTLKVIDGKLIDARDPKANPKIIHYWKGEGSPAAGFHHTFQLVKDNKGNLIGAGDVIRIGNAASIGVYNAATDKIYGINYTPYSGYNFAGIALWKDLVIYSMKSKWHGKPKLYFYNPSANKMVDSIKLGFEDYGKIFIQDNILTGFAGNRIYKVSLSEKKLIYNYEFSKTEINDAYMLHDGRFVVSTLAKLPDDLKQVISVPAINFLEANNIMYGIYGSNVVRINIK